MDVLETIQKNQTEEIRVGLDKFNGYDLFAARVFFESSDGTKRPGKSGIAFKVSLLPRFAEGIASAMIEARKRGLLK